MVELIEIQLRSGTAHAAIAVLVPDVDVLGLRVSGEYIGDIEVIKYLTGIVSANRLADLERELQELISKCKDDQALYMAIQIASGLK